MAESLKNQFSLNPEVIFLNHGSFGACPKPVFESYQYWQRELEYQPVEFLGRNATSLLAESRTKLAEFLNCQPEDLIYFPNPTTAVNMVARNLDLQPGDEILTTDHEYGALDRTWKYFCNKTGARYIQRPIPLPVTTHAEFVERFWQGVTSNTKIIFISHITSPTALTFPIEEICRRARQVGILTIIDGAHAPGQIPLNLREIDADIYVGACHKWMMAPKGSSFLYAQKEIQSWLDPLVISWGYSPDPGFGSGNSFIDYHEWQGTRDIAAFLAVPAAIEFMKQNKWVHVQQACHNLAVETRRKLHTLTGLPPISPEKEIWFHQMFTSPLPDIDLDRLKIQLYDDYQIEIPMIDWNGQNFIRVSIQGYNTTEELDVFISALADLLDL